MQSPVNSHILIHQFDYVEPATLEEAIGLLAAGGPRVRALAGGTDLLVHLKMERGVPDGGLEALVGLGRIPGLAAVEPEAGGLRIGALATIRTLRGHPAVGALYPALCEACASFSTTQVQTMGTLGGNLCNGSPASDTAPALIAYGAEVVLAGPAGERRLPVERFFRGPGQTALEPGEILTAVILPPPAETLAAGARSGGAFLKIGRVAADIAKASCAAVIEREGECVRSCRLAFGAVAPTPRRARRAESLLAGQPFSESLAAQAAALAAGEVSPIDDVRSSASYRRQIAGVMAHDALLRAWERAATGVHAFSAPASAINAAAPSGPAATPPARHPAIGLSDRPTLRVSRSAFYPVTLTVNGVSHRLAVAPHELLLNVLRDRLELTGAKYGCGIGECSACTVQMDGRPVLACLVLAIAADGHEIVTVEGLRRADGRLDPLQEAFLQNAAYQCGFCTPGMLMTAKSLLAEQPSPTEADVRDYLKGNLCRCTGYASIVRAVLAAAAKEET